jgi:hypothetical protein
VRYGRRDVAKLSGVEWRRPQVPSHQLQPRAVAVQQLVATSRARIGVQRDAGTSSNSFARARSEKGPVGILAGVRTRDLVLAAVVVAATVIPVALNAGWQAIDLAVVASVPVLCCIAARCSSD